MFEVSPETTKNKLVCEQHFYQNCFIKKTTAAKGRLFKNAVPKPYKSGVIAVSYNQNVGNEEQCEIINVDEDDEDSPEIIHLKCQEIVDSDESVVAIDPSST